MPSTHAEFEIRDIDRAWARQKGGGKSIMQQIREGKVFSDFLLKEEELDVQMNMQRNPPEQDEEDIELEDLEGQVFDSEGKPLYDKDGNSIDYD